MVNDSAPQPLVSIVAPVYNGEAFLADTIESVLAQTYQNWEFFLLDNASTDRTAAIIRRYAEKDARIRPLSNPETLPIMENWNSAFRDISEDSVFTKVVHADDLLMPECLERMVRLGLRHPSAAVIAAYRLDGRRVDLNVLPYPQSFISGKELCRLRMLGRCAEPFGSPSSIMYRSADVRARKEFYPEDNIHADTEICFELLREGDYALEHQVLTYTRHHEAAQTTDARKTGSHGIARLLIANKYGGYFLSPAERRRAIDMQAGYHYIYLARRPWRFLTDKAFRAHHRQALNSNGSPFSWLKFALATGKESLKRTQAAITSAGRRRMQSAV
jgi:glycosyltransferase involved in cell wall biosynthesis